MLVFKCFTDYDLVCYVIFCCITKFLAELGHPGGHASPDLSVSVYFPPHQRTLESAVLSYPSPLPHLHNLGIGKFIALDFARRGARVILACRNEARGNAAQREIRELSGNANVHLRLVDVSSLQSVREFAATVLEEEKEIHILVNNAGASGTTSATKQFKQGRPTWSSPRFFFYCLWFKHIINVLHTQARLAGIHCTP